MHLDEVDQSKVMEPNIDKILISKKYKLLRAAYKYSQDDAVRRCIRPETFIKYCELLNEMMKDNQFWKNYQIPNNLFHDMRLRYTICGGVLKTVFLMHERNKRRFLDVFKTEYVKTFRLSGQIVKIVIVKKIKDKNGKKNDQQSPLPGLSTVRSSGPECDLLPQNGDVPVPLVETVERNAIPQTLSHATPLQHVITQDVPQNPLNGSTTAENLTRLDQQKKKTLNVNLIELLEENEQGERPDYEIPKRRREEVVEGSDEIHMIRQFLRESGLGIEGHENITEINELQRVLERTLSLNSPDLQTPVAPPLPGFGSQKSDDVPRVFQVQAEVHPVAAHLISPVSVPQPIEGTEIVSQEMSAIMRQTETARPSSENVEELLPIQASTIPPPNTFQIEVEVHDVPQRIDQADGTDDAPFRGFPSTYPTEVVATGSRINHDLITTIETDQQIVENVRSSSARKRPADNEIPGPVVERINSPDARKVTRPKQTIADILIYGTDPQLPAEILAGVQRSDLIFKEPAEIRTSRLPEQREEVQPPLQIRDLLKDFLEEKPIPRRKQKKNIFFSHLVLSRKMKKKIRPEGYISHAERLKNAMHIRRPISHRVIPMDCFDRREDTLRFIRPVQDKSLFRGYADSNEVIENLMCQLFEDDEDLLNENLTFEDRVNDLRASVFVPKEIPPRFSLPREIRDSLRNEERMKRSLVLINREEPLLPLPQQNVPKRSSRWSNVPRVSIPQLQSTLVEELNVSAGLPRPTTEITSNTPAARFSSMAKDLYSIEKVVPQEQLRKPAQRIIDVTKIPPEIAEQLREHEDLIVPLKVQAANALVQEEIIPRRRTIFSKDDLLEKLNSLWSENPEESVAFTEICPPESTNKFTASQAFSALLDFYGMKKLDLNQEPGSWSPGSLFISPYVMNTSDYSQESGSWSPGSLLTSPYVMNTSDYNQEPGCSSPESLLEFS